MTIATILLTKIVVATSIAALAAMVQRRSVYAELAYAVWFSVLVVLLIPALVAIPVPAWVATNLETAVSSGLAVFGWAGALGAQRSGVLAAVLTVVPESSNILPVTVLLVWLVGCGLVFYRQVHGLQLIARLVRFAVPAAPLVAARCSAIARELRIRRCPRVVTAGGTFSPFLWHPCCGPASIVVPSELLTRWSVQSTDAVLRHELVHFRRNDAWRRRLEILVLTLWWWLPTTWLARQRLRELEEVCTDAAVLRSNPQGARAYARALLDTEEYLDGSDSRAWLVVSSFTSRGSLQSGSLKTRITRIVDQERYVGHSSRLFGCCLSVLLISLGLLTAGRPHLLTETRVVRTPAKPAPRRTASATPETFGQYRALPDIKSVTVRNSEREIVLKWSQPGSLANVRTIRLIRVSDDGVEPLLWKIEQQPGIANNERDAETHDLEWIFAFLNQNNEIIDGNGTRHSHPDLARLSSFDEGSELWEGNAAGSFPQQACS